MSNATFEQQVTLIRRLMVSTQQALVPRAARIHELAQDGKLLRGNIDDLIKKHERAEAATEILHLLDMHDTRETLSAALHNGLWRSAAEDKKPHKADLYGSMYALLNGTGDF